MVDAPARGLGLDHVLAPAPQYELAVLHTSTPPFQSDCRVAEAMKDANRRLTLGFVGAHVAELPELSLRRSQASGSTSPHTGRKQSSRKS